MSIKRLFLTLCLYLVIGISCIHAEHLVILTSNDTHSHIDPDFDGKGGLLRQKVMFDSVLCAEKNVMRIHAGDAVQGTLYFSEFHGKVEYEMLNRMNFDIAILGNHEFDNGMQQLAKHYKKMRPVCLSSNYDFAGTELEVIFQPYIIREFDGKKIGFIGINLDPSGIIAETNYKGIRFHDITATADSTARLLKQEKGVDFVVMVSHIGYDMTGWGVPGDIDVIKHSTDIDLVIGGHSHTVINPDKKGSPAWLIANKNGRMIPVTQTGNLGKYVGLIDIDLETFTTKYRLLPVDKRYDSRINYPEIEAFLAPYRQKVDSLMNKEVAISAKFMDKGLGALSNWVSDAARDITVKLSGITADCSIMNKGGIRCAMPEGSVSEGLINSMFPFDNRLQIIELTGEQLLRSLEIMAARGGDATSSELIVTYTPNNKIKSAKINGKDIKPKKKYKIVTLDYLANGGDYMSPFKEAKLLFSDEVKVSVRYMSFIKELTAQGRKIDASDELRMTLTKE